MKTKAIAAILLLIMCLLPIFYFLKLGGDYNMVEDGFIKEEHDVQDVHVGDEAEIAEETNENVNETVNEIVNETVENETSVAITAVPNIVVRLVSASKINETILEDGHSFSTYRMIVEGSVDACGFVGTVEIQVCVNVTAAPGGRNIYAGRFIGQGTWSEYITVKLENGDDKVSFVKEFIRDFYGVGDYYNIHPETFMYYYRITRPYLGEWIKGES